MDFSASETKQFPQFDIVTDYSDHHYAGLEPSASTGSAVYNNILKEWKILNHNLPESIYVQVYEGRIDLLRAVIVGASGTPYHHGLFFFDIAFPSDYPNRPPQVQYRSYGLQLNPNLYRSGHVCLSLLNTWSGKPEEMWVPSKSTVLQVLLSLQALVLNEEPCFNEPLFTRWLFKLGSRGCYNNEVFLSSCHTMMFILEKPPKNFECFVVEHFRKYARIILTAHKAYTNGYVKVGHHQDDDGLFLAERVHVSSFFKCAMNMQYPNLVTAFAMKDPSLREFTVQLDQMIEKTENEYIEKAKENKKEGMTFFGILKKIFLLNKCVQGNADEIEIDSS